MSETARTILHMDMDAFYASVEMLDNADLRGKPVIVGGTTNRGVVSAASYEARKFGVHSAMPIMQARKLCPHGVFLGVRMPRYQEISRMIMEIFHRFTPLVEPLSLDEAFLDVTASKALKGDGQTIAREIKRLVLTETGLTVSAGVASCKLIAKIASDQNKPDGLTVVPHGTEKEFLAPLPINRLWGVGQATRKTLALVGVSTIGDLSRLPEKILIAKFGDKHGHHLRQVSQGIDSREVTPEHDVKSIGNEETFAKDLVAFKRIRQELLALCTQVGKRARAHGISGKTITVKVKYGDFQQVTRATTLPSPVNDDRSLYQAGCELLTKTEAGRRPIRLLGLTISNLTPAGKSAQLGLFTDSGLQKKREDLYQAMDAISNRYGRAAIIPGKLLDTEEE